MYDRRQVLLAGGATALAALLARHAAAQTASAPKVRKALMLYMCKDGKSLREKFEIIRRAGFEGVELDSPSPIPLSEALEARDATGLAVCGTVDSVHWRKQLADPSAEVRKEALEADVVVVSDVRSPSPSRRHRGAAP